MAEFKDVLRDVRKGRRMTQLDLATAVGVSKRTVWNWENGASYPTLSDMVVLADMFGCTLDHLAGRDG